MKKVARLFDRVMKSKNISSEVKSWIRGIPVIKIDNVTKYMFYQLSVKPALSNRDFPCVAPPFEYFWMETYNPTLTGCFNDAYGGRWDMLSTTKKWGVWVYPYYSTTRGRIENKFCLQLFLDIRNTILQAPFYWSYIIGENGALKDLTLSSDHEWVELEYLKKVNVPEARAYYLSIFLAISFMHCKKQVKLIEHTPPEKVQRKRIHRNKLPLTKYYTLDIEPLKEILRTEGRIHEIGLQKALHICRGHFKDYSQGKGLFGKYKGLYWWDSQIRGSEKAGAVVKDYTLKLNR